MPCVKPARGTRNGGADSHPPFNDAIDNNPCGKPAVTSVGGVNVTTHSLCLPHLGAKLGLADAKPPIVFEP